MNKKNEKSFKIIKEIIELPKLNKVLNSIEQEQLETEIYRILIDIELSEKILADKNKWIVELLNEIEEQRKEIKELKTITNSYNSYNVDNMNGYNIIIADSEYFANGTFVNKFISKDKIRDKIKEITDRTANIGLFIDKETSIKANAKREVLKELLKE